MLPTTVINYLRIPKRQELLVKLKVTIGDDLRIKAEHTMIIDDLSEYDSIFHSRKIYIFDKEGRRHLYYYPLDGQIFNKHFTIIKCNNM